MSGEQETRLGLFAGLGAFCIWGLAPLYFKLLGHVGADEIIAHRVLWSVVLLALFLLARHGRGVLRHVRIPRRTLAALALSGVLIVCNWLIFVYAIHSDQVLSTSLGYFINPLVSVMFGLIFFRESLNGLRLLAVLVAAAGTLYMTIRVGQFPWLALALAVSFALYGVVRKKTDVGPMVGLFWETVLVAPLALAWLWWLARAARLQFDMTEAGEAALLAGTGLLTLVPLVLFAAAVRRLQLGTVGLMQYLAPSMTFVLAVFVFGEPFTPDHAVTFTCIWVALALFTWGGWVRHRQARIPVK